MSAGFHVKYPKYILLEITIEKSSFKNLFCGHAGSIVGIYQG